MFVYEMYIHRNSYNVYFFFYYFAALLYGFTGLLLTFIVANFGDLIQASLIVYGLVAGPTLGVFILGVLTSKTNEKVTFIISLKIHESTKIFYKLRYTIINELTIISF